MIKRLLSGCFQNGKGTIRKIYGTLAFGWFFVMLGAVGAVEMDEVSLPVGLLICFFGLFCMFRCLEKSGAMDEPVYYEDEENE